MMALCIKRPNGTTIAPYLFTVHQVFYSFYAKVCQLDVYKAAPTWDIVSHWVRKIILESRKF